MTYTDQMLERVNALSIAKRALLANRLGLQQSSAPESSPIRLTGYATIHNKNDRDQCIGENLLTWLKERLPDYMIPSEICVVDDLPRLPNGKIDRLALSQIQRQIGPSENGCDEPRTDNERILVRIWCKVLGSDHIGIHDNFFEVGGDSIRSIQIISLARQEGLAIGPTDLIEHPTIAELAVAAENKVTASTEQEADLVESPLTPIQAWFFQLQLALPHHWNQSALFEAPPDLDVQSLARALDHCLQHHDALRTRFDREDGHWRQIVVAPNQIETPLAIVDLTSEPDAQQEVAMHKRIALTQSGLDLSAGRLLRAVLFQRGPAKPGLLLIAIHHLVMDVVSWSILIEDLETAYAQASAGAPVSLPPKTTPYRRWARRLAEWSDSQALRAEAKHWVKPAVADSNELPVDFTDDRIATEATAKTVTVTLDPQRTDALLTEAHHAYQTRVDELLVAALVLGVNQWTGQTAIRLEMEKHGRTDRFEGIDVSRTIGWFTATYPVSLNLESPHDPGTVIKSIKEQLRAVPENGLGYGVQRYLSTDPQIVKALETQPSAKVLFNYLGRLQQNSDSDLFKWVSRVAASSRDPANIRPHLLEINAAIDDDRLVLDFTYSETRYCPETIQTLAQHVTESLETLIDYCRAPDAGGYTPSDFPDADLTQTELDRFLDGID